MQSSGELFLIHLSRQVCIIQRPEHWPGTKPPKAFGKWKLCKSDQEHHSTSPHELSRLFPQKFKKKKEEKKKERN